MGIETPVDHQRLGELLKRVSYPPDKVEYLVQGFAHGFKICHMGPKPPGYPRNHQITECLPNIICSKINKEIKCIAGPFQEHPILHLVLNPLGLVPKTTKDGRDLPSLAPLDPKSYHLIMDLRKSKVNVGIAQEDSRVEYTEFDTIIGHCSRFRKGVFLAKIDIEVAYHHIPIHPDDW